MKTIPEKYHILPAIRILDLADEKASFCSKILADLGATVIKVEPPCGDATRHRGPFLKTSSHPEESLSFLYNNINKLGITLNIEHRLGREIFLKLTEIAEVMVETFPPGFLRDLELDFDVLSKVNPRLILVSVTGFGQSGPRRNFKACDSVASAYGGQMYTAGLPAKSPLKPYGDQSYHAASLYGAIAILIARRKLVQTGRGEHIDISLQEVVTSTLEHQMVRYFYEKAIPKRQGGLHWNNQFCILPCRDGFIQTTLFHQWETLVEWLASEGMVEDLQEDHWKEEDFRLKHVDHVIEVLQRWTKKHTVRELFELGQLMHFPWAPIMAPEAVLDCPQHQARGFFINVCHSEEKKALKIPRLPYQFSSHKMDRCKRAPFVGEDNVNIYVDELGLTQEDLTRLSIEKVI